MNNYYFVVSTITRTGKVEQNTVTVFNAKNKFEALNKLREMYSEPEYTVDFIHSNNAIYK